MTKHCETCRHWRKLDDMWRVPGGWGNCELFNGLPGGPIRPDALAYATEHDYAQSSFITSPKFGCIQHTPRFTEDEQGILALSDTPQEGEIDE